MPLKPIDQACLEAARRLVCGDLGEILVLEDGRLIVARSPFKLRPSSDPTDALISLLARAMKKHLRGIELGKLRDDLLRAGVEKEWAVSVFEHLVSFTVEDWDAIRARVDFYAEYNVETALPKTDTSGVS